MKSTSDISETVERELLSWPDATVGQHRFDESRGGKTEIGHLHGNAVADRPFPRAPRDELVSSGKVSPHHQLPDSGCLSFYGFHGTLHYTTAPADVAPERFFRVSARR